MPAIGRWEKTCGKHPTQKPLRLLVRMILAPTNQGDWILDPFSGSSTTVFDIKNTGLNYRRHYYGNAPTRTPPQKGHGKIWLGKHIVQWSKIHLCQWLRAFEIFFSHSFSFRHFLAWCLFGFLMMA